MNCWLHPLVAGLHIAVKSRRVVTSLKTTPHDGVMLYHDLGLTTDLNVDALDQLVVKINVIFFDIVINVVILERWYLILESLVVIVEGEDVVQVIKLIELTEVFGLKLPGELFDLIATRLGAIVL